MITRLQGWLWVVSVATIAMLSVGCTGSYLVRQTAGQVELLARARPIDSVRADPELDPEYREAFDEIEEILTFAAAHGFRVENAYQTYVDLEGRSLVHVLVACRPDRLQPYVWDFPLVGAFSYKGYFDRSAALRAQARLEAEGYETYLGRSDAFSSLGWFPDPVYSSFLEQDVADRADLLFHELTHRTVFVPDETRLNESLAMFVARRATEQFLTERGLPESGEALRRYRARQRDRERLVTELARCRGDLAVAFAAPDRSRRMEARERILEALSSRLQTVPFESRRYRGYREVRWNLPLLLSFDTYTGDVARLETEWRASGRNLAAWLDALANRGGWRSLLTPE